MKRAIPFLVALAVATPVLAADGGEVLKAKGCLNCHDFDKKKVGPAYKDVAAKYKDDKDASGKIIEKLKSGKGHPVKSSAPDEELRAAVDKVLATK